MRRIYLFCDNAMSTSLLASRMQKVADANKLPLEVKAFSQTQLEEIITQYKPDAVLLGPQVKHIYEKVQEKYGRYGMPIFVIDPDDYGQMNGERVLKRALLAIKKGTAKC